MQPTSIFSRSLKYNPRVSSRLIIRVGIIILVFLTPQSIITVNSVSNINTNVSSILVSEVDGGLIHIQVSNTNSQVIWKRNNPLSDYDNLYVDDLNLDGEYEIIAELSNVALELIDFKTGELIWSHNLENTFSTSRDIVTGDLDGDSVKEIIVTNRIEKEFEDKAISVYNSITGDVISRIQTPSNSSSYGSDNVAVHDLNNDGTNEIILSFGAALWDYDNNQGQYLLQVLTYNKENSNFTTIWERTGSDIGGNTRMKVIEYSDETLIVTSGWYDNPIRAWNSQGDLLWENRLVNTTEKIILAENGLEIVKINNEVHLFAMQKNYWDNYTLSLFNINPLTGNYYDPPIQINEVSSISGNAGKEGIYLNIKHWMHDNNQIYTEEMLHYYNYTSKKLENMVHNGQKWKNVMVSDTINSYINIKDKFEGILAVDDTGIIWLSTLNRNYPIYDSVNAGIRDVYVMNNIDEHLEGTIQ